MVGAVGIEPTTFAKIIARVKSVYPTLAQQTRVQGGSNRSDAASSARRSGLHGSKTSSSKALEIQSENVQQQPKTNYRYPSGCPLKLLKRYVKDRQPSQTISRVSFQAWQLGTHLALQWSSQYPVASHPVTLSKSHVPAVYLALANSLVLSFYALIEINKLCLINQAQNSDSPRLHQLFSLVSSAQEARE